MMSIIPLNTFLTVLPNTNLTYSHADIISIHNGSDTLKQETAPSSVAYYVHTLLYNAAEQIFTCYCSTVVTQHSKGFAGFVSLAIKLLLFQTSVHVSF
jgi:hypothetical protein